MILIVGEYGEFSSQHDFELNIQPGSSYSFGYVNEEEKRLRRESISRELERFIKEGEKFFVEPVNVDWDKFYSEAHEWRNKIYGWIRRLFGLTVSERFHSVLEMNKFPHEIPAGRSGFLDELYTQFVNLKETAEDFKVGKIKLPFDL